MARDIFTIALNYYRDMLKQALEENDKAKETKARQMINYYCGCAEALAK